MEIYWGQLLVQLIGVLILLFVLVLVVILIFKVITALNIYIDKNKIDNNSK